MSIFDKLIESATGVRHRVGFERQPLTLALEESGPRPVEYYTADEYAMQLRVTATYRVDNRTGQGGQRRARDTAMQVLRHTLYADLLLLQSQLMHALSDGDKDEAVRLCCQLRKEIVG